MDRILLRSSRNGIAKASHSFFSLSNFKNDRMMPKGKINLEEILLSKIPKDCYWEDMGNLTNCPQQYAIDAMKEACKQVLELAAENANVSDGYIANQRQILDTINQVE